MDVIVFTRSDGGVTVRNLPEGSTFEDFQVAIQHAIDSGKAVDVPGIVKRANLPSQRENAAQNLRDAWKWDGGRVVVDPVKIKPKG